jgi:hypothetical protein
MGVLATITVEKRRVIMVKRTSMKYDVKKNQYEGPLW